MKKIIIGKVRSSSNPKVFHTQYLIGDKKFCTCIGYRARKNCKHLNPKGENMKIAKATKSNSAKKLAAPKGNSTRAVMINTLLRNKGKLVSITSIKSEIEKAKGKPFKKADQAIKLRAKGVGRWANRRGLALVKAGKGFKLTPAA